jgi:hypothetical protein
MIDAPQLLNNRSEASEIATVPMNAIEKAIEQGVLAPARIDC